MQASYVYDSFGNLTSSTGTLTNSIRYTGREFDSETGLYYYRARYYDPEVGRLMNEDTIGFSGGVNFFAYVGNNPVIFNDLLGLCEDSRWIKSEKLPANFCGFCSLTAAYHASTSSLGRNPSSRGIFPFSG